LLKLIHDVKDLRLDEFACIPTRQESNSDPRPRIKAALSYDKWLRKQSKLLTHCCTDSDLDDRHESEWVASLLPTVFYRFNRNQEEKAQFHHWYGRFLNSRLYYLYLDSFVCRRHFPRRSRPLINGTSDTLPIRSFSEGIETWYVSNYSYCYLYSSILNKFCQRHPYKSTQF
jgi:hypothetical protein